MTRNTIISILILIAAIVTMLLMIKTPAHADGWAHCWDLGPCQQRARRARRRSKPKVEHYYAPPRWEDVEIDPDRSPRCLDTFIDVTSTEHTNKDNGMEAARKMWMAKTQWHHGSKYMHPDLAQDFSAGCRKSNAMDTMSGRISETTNKLIGQEGQNMRCVILARPCRMVLEKVEGHK